MENVFSTNASETMKREINLIDSEEQTGQIDNLNEYFEISKVADWIKQNKYKSIALQFPDELLTYSSDICIELQKQCDLNTDNESKCVTFILGDTSYGSCCVDFVAAQHYSADAIVHYGHSCLSKTDKLPVYYVFEKFKLDLDSVITEINKICAKIDSGEYTEKKIIIIYDVSCFHLHDSLKALENDKIFLSDLDFGDKEQIDDRLHLYSRLLPKDLQKQASDYVFFYIGSKESLLNSFQLYFNKNKFIQYNLTNKQIQIETYQQTKRKLMRRFYLIEKAKDAKIFGILVGTMAVSKYKDAVNHASGILKKAKRRYYSFLIGKLNCAKLNNFMEVDMYVLIACHENSIIESKELNKPIITLYELEIAYNCARLWGEEFVVDYRQLLPGMDHYIPIELSNTESDVSLITGDLRHLATNNDDNDKNECNSLIKRDDALSVIHHSGAGEFLKNRSWTGLEQKLGETPVTQVVEGRKGTAMGYEEESTNPQ